MTVMSRAKDILVHGKLESILAIIHIVDEVGSDLGKLRKQVIARVEIIRRRIRLISSIGLPLKIRHHSIDELNSSLLA